MINITESAQAYFRQNRQRLVIALVGGEIGVFVGTQRVLLGELCMQRVGAQPVANLVEQFAGGGELILFFELFQ